MIKQVEYAPGYYDIIFTKKDKDMIRCIIGKCITDMDIWNTNPNLTKIHWSRSWQSDLYLHISISVEGVIPMDMRFTHRTGIWYSNTIDLKIPHSEMREYKLNKLLNK